MAADGGGAQSARGAAVKREIATDVINGDDDFHVRALVNDTTARERLHLNDHFLDLDLLISAFHPVSRHNHHHSI